MFLIDSSHNEPTGRWELIGEKVARPVGAPRLSRTRLLDLLDRSMESGTSTIVSGRAGAGKTALAIDFADKCKRPVAWYKVDAPEADPKLFFQYLVASIREHRPNFGAGSLMPLVERIDLNHIAWLAEAFVFELADGADAGPLLLVIEDLHQVSDSDWLVPFFNRFLPLLPSDVHVLITSRNLPPAPLWRMRSKQSLVVIDEEALAFTKTESAALFETYGLSNEQANIALDHTHGRAAALDEFASFLSRQALPSPATSKSADATQWT
ncbi:MAG TPA: hypothetical protein VJU86_07860 [Pyrinomonadaceae bacterium]|nr:hypothetical protein [Pyrinomonadaceae bacterium]